MALGDHVADRSGDRGARADRVVVAGDHKVDPLRVAVGVDQADDRNPQPLRLFDRDRLGLEIDHEYGVRRALHVLDAAEIRAELLQVGLGRHALPRRQQLQLAVGLVALEVVQPPDPQRDRLEVRQQPAEPAVVDVRHVGGLGRLANRIARLLLGADEHDRAAPPGDILHELLCLPEQLLGLDEVDDVDAVALAEDESAHLRIPTARLVAEMHAGLQQLLDSHLSH